MFQIHQRAELFQAFADPTRLRILALLTAGELCVCHLVEALQESQPKVSRHLAILRSAGLVATRRDGRWIHYALADADDPATRRLLKCATDCLTPLPEMQADRKRLAAVLARDCC
ncbi:MAG TPA: metalloregulator ArsR/SmtB family transcription factor [Planctomycetes bacterium]|nr:metalloregulator ArsR/SmtB family transcription factor [Planctomycetota bacterium]